MLLQTKEFIFFPKIESLNESTEDIMIKNNKIINILNFHQYQCFWKKNIARKIDNFAI